MDEPYVDWRTQGKCANLTPEKYDMLFFPDAGRSINKAKKFCLGCPVSVQCLEQALADGSQGIWAGTTYTERLKMNKFRNLVSSSPPKPRKVIRKNFKVAS